MHSICHGPVSVCVTSCTPINMAEWMKLVFGKVATALCGIRVISIFK